jgi:hypothetical protein
VRTASPGQLDRELQVDLTMGGQDKPVAAAYRRP